MVRTGLYETHFGALLKGLLLFVASIFEHCSVLLIPPAQGYAEHLLVFSGNELLQ
jgi:hypothetical protein